MESRPRGNDGVQDSTAVHVTSSTPPSTYPPFRSTAFDPPDDLDDNTPVTATAAAYRRSAGGDDGRLWSQGLGFLAGDRRTATTAQLVPDTSVAADAGERTKMRNPQLQDAALTSVRRPAGACPAADSPPKARAKGRRCSPAIPTRNSRSSFQ